MIWVLLPEMSLTGLCPDAAVTLHDEHIVELGRMTADGPASCFGLAEASPAAGLDRRPAITQVPAGDGRIIRLHRKMDIARPMRRSTPDRAVAAGRLT